MIRTHAHTTTEQDREGVKSRVIYIIGSLGTREEWEEWAVRSEEWRVKSRDLLLTGMIPLILSEYGDYGIIEANQRPKVHEWKSERLGGSVKPHRWSHGLLFHWSSSRAVDWWAVGSGQWAMGSGQWAVGTDWALGTGHHGPSWMGCYCKWSMVRYPIWLSFPLHRPSALRQPKTNRMSWSGPGEPARGKVSYLVIVGWGITGTDRRWQTSDQQSNNNHMSDLNDF